MIVQSTVSGSNLQLSSDKMPDGRVRLYLDKVLPTYRHESGFNEVLFLTNQQVEDLIKMLRDSQESFPVDNELWHRPRKED